MAWKLDDWARFKAGQAPQTETEAVSWAGWRELSPEELAKDHAPPWSRPCCVQEREAG